MTKKSLTQRLEELEKEVGNTLISIFYYLFNSFY